MAKMAGVVTMMLVALTACSVESSVQRPGCDSGSGMIAAQSVPSAEYVPCLQPPPEGWTVDTVSITQDGTVVRLDSDRAGDNAAELRFGDQCEPGAAVSVPSDLPPAERFDDIERLEPGFKARVYYVFEGGCVTWVFDFDNDASATESVALEDTLILISRADLNEEIQRQLVDEEL